tara:strand:+ start:5236 stop:5439 length:204 start_codon:yes stop_codon:yes gene_type:complete
MEKPLSKLVRIKEAQDLLGVSRSYVYRLMDKGILESRKIGNARRIVAESLRNILENGYTDETNETDR